MALTPIRSLPTRLLHLALLTAVLWQLTASGLVERPRIGRPGNLFYRIHEVVGLTALGVVLAFWLWSAIRRREPHIAALFPWYSPPRVLAVIADLKAHLAQLREWRLPAAAAEMPLASAVHGLGLLTASAMAASGAWLYTENVPGGIVLQIHRALANLMWTYVIAHAGLAVLHQVMGHAVLQRMFGRRIEFRDADGVPPANSCSSRRQP